MGILGPIINKAKAYRFINHMFISYYGATTLDMNTLEYSFSFDLLNMYDPEKVLNQIRKIIDPNYIERFQTSNCIHFAIKLNSDESRHIVKQYIYNNFPIVIDTEMKQFINGNYDYNNFITYGSKGYYSTDIICEISMKDMLQICQQFIPLNQFVGLTIYKYGKAHIAFATKEAMNEFRNKTFNIVIEFIEDKKLRKQLNEELLLLPRKGSFPGGYEYQKAEDRFYNRYL